MRLHQALLRLPAVAVLAMFAHLPAAGQAHDVQSNRSLLLSDHYARAHDYDLLHQRIAVGGFNWDSLSFSGAVTTTVVAMRAGLDAIVLDEGKLLVNTSVIDRAGRAMRTSRAGDTLTVYVAMPLRLGDTLVFTIAYHGRIKSGDGLTFIRNDGLRHRPDQVWSMGETNSNHYWFPTYDAPNDKMTWEVIATVPREDLAVSNGRLVSNVTSGVGRIMTWRQDTPASSYLVSLVVAPLVVQHDNWQGIPVDYYTYREDSTRAWPLFHVTTDMIETYSRLTGVRYPWPKYAQTTVADFFGGMENVSATTLVDWLPDARAYLDRPWYQYILLPHELAHQWFGDYVTMRDWAHTWLNEGFAEFMPGQYWQAKLGAHAEEDYYVDEYRQYLEIEARRSMPLASMGSNNLYPKGALVLKMLKDYLGADRFWKAVHGYLTAHAFGNATSDDLRRAVLAATGEDLEWFWDEWIYSAGLPQFRVSASFDAAASQLKLRVQQTQVDTFRPDSTNRLFRVPEVFRMPVTIRLALANGERRIRADLNARDQVITIDSVTSDPAMVVFDDGNHILKTLEFDQPVPWLAEQLRRDDNLWNRQWVLGQLARHPDDPKASMAVAAAATGADYFLTRVQATGALSAFPAAIAKAPLLAAVKDSSAAVRAAAIEALGHVGGSDVAAVIIATYHGDSSYTVRAAALTALAEVDPVQVHPILAAALRTPSYQDAIEITALVTVAQINDTSYLSEVDRLTATQELASNILAVFAARGSTHALDLLTARLDDPSAAVRRWVVRQFRQTLASSNRSMALGRLENTVATLKHADTKLAVSDLIAALRQP